MITELDVREFMEKVATNGLPAAEMDVKPDQNVAGAQTLKGKAWNLIKGQGGLDTLFRGMAMYGIYSGAKDAYGAYDKYRDYEKQLAHAVPGINTLSGRNPFTSAIRGPKTPYEKDLEERGPIEANLLENDRMIAMQHARKARTAQSDTQSKIKSPIDYTTVRQFQKEHKTDTVPVKRYQRG